MQVIIHSSKTMRKDARSAFDLSTPRLINKSIELINYLKSLDIDQIAKSMKLSKELANKTIALIDSWTIDPKLQVPAAESFIGDIYSGLSANKWSQKDWQYANKHLFIISGLYGFLRPSDGIYPYRLEMGYKFANPKYSNIYSFWGSEIADLIPKNDIILNLTSVEYSKSFKKYLNNQLFIEPKFLSVNPKTLKPVVVAVHSKIARGNMASWIIQNRVEDINKIKDYNNLGYDYVKDLSTPNVPTFVCEKFGGIGLSIRLDK